MGQTSLLEPPTGPISRDFDALKKAEAEKKAAAAAAPAK
jgi:hypothetical protein